MMPTIDHKALSDTLSLVKQRIARDEKLLKKDRMNEITTISLLIEPVLNALGWDITDPTQMKRGHGTSDGGQVDLALFHNGSALLYIEAKPLHEINATEQPKWIKQAIQYANADGVEWCVLTNGEKYRIFRTHAKVEKNIKEKNIADITISDTRSSTSPNADSAILYLLSPQSLEKELLTKIWEMRSVDQKLENVLQNINQKPEFHRLLSRILRDSNFSKAQIMDSLKRSKINIKYPKICDYAEDIIKNERTAESKSRSASSSKNEHQKRTKNLKQNSEKKAKKMRTDEMVKRGVLEVGTILKIKNRPGSDAEVISGKKVRYKNIDMSFNKWGRTVLGRSESIYNFAILPDKRTLDDLRQEVGMKGKGNHSALFEVSVKSKTKIHKRKKGAQKPKISRTKRMLTEEMVNTGLLKRGTILTIKGQPEFAAQVLNGKEVIYRNERMSFNQWGKLVLGGERSIYLYATIPDGRTLDELRSNK